MIKVGIIGCGKIADLHAESIRRVPKCMIVAVCDREILMAQQLAERYSIPRYFDDAVAMLEAVKPDVVHITTPPQAHLSLGMLCLDAGCNIYVEKPLTMNTGEVEKLLQHSLEKKRKVTVGHNLQFSHEAIRMRKLIRGGFLGSLPVHMESYYCYNLDRNYAHALFGDKEHWVRKLPGKLLHNIISHGISRITEFLPGENPSVTVNGFTSPFLRGIGETEIIDELRVIINDNNAVTAYFTFSTQMSPKLNQFRVYGLENGLVVDHFHRSLVRLKKTKLKSFMNYFFSPLVFGREYAANSFHNVWQFLRRNFHDDSGMKFLIEAFYRSIEEDSDTPISYREIRLTAKIMDEIFSQLNAQKTH